MFKIICQCYDPMDIESSLIFDMLPEKFESKQAARDFLLKEVFPQDESDAVDEDDDLAEIVSFDIEDYDSELIHSRFFGNDLVGIADYKIMEV